MAALADRSGDLGEHVALSEATLDRVRETLRATVLDEEVRQRVEAGRLTHEGSGVGLGLVPSVGTEAEEPTAGAEPDVEDEADEEEELEETVAEEGEEPAEEEEPAVVSTAVREAEAADAAAIGRLLHDFNTEYDEHSPGPEAVAGRVRELLAGGDTAVLLGGEGPDGLAVLRFRPSIWSQGLECYLAELYVVPDLRGHGLGRALMEASMDRARREGADYMDLGTSEDDVAARALYESLGFSNREGRPDGPLNYFYEREL